MAEYIDRNRVIEIIKDWKTQEFDNCSRDYNIAYDDALTAVEDLLNERPAADVQEVINCPQAENAELKQRLSKAVKWISVNDRLPEVEMTEQTRLIDGVDNGKSFLICSEDGYVDIDTFWAKAKEFNCDDVAYWMPLPEPPKEL